MEKIKPNNGTHSQAHCLFAFVARCTSSLHTHTHCNVKQPYALLLMLIISSYSFFLTQGYGFHTSRRQNGMRKGGIIAAMDGERGCHGHCGFLQCSREQQKLSKRQDVALPLACLQCAFMEGEGWDRNLLARVKPTGTATQRVQPLFLLAVTWRTGNGMDVVTGWLQETAKKFRPGSHYLYGQGYKHGLFSGVLFQDEKLGPIWNAGICSGSRRLRVL